MECYNKDVEEILFGISVHDVMTIIKSGIKLVGDETKIRKKPLETILRYEIPKLKIYYKPLNKVQAQNIIQELTHQKYLTISNNNPNLRSELYFELGEKGKKVMS